MTRSSPNQGAFLLRPAVALSLVAVLTGCATRPFEAAGDVHALMVAIRNDDHAAFEAHIDRVALKANIQARMIAQARATGLPGVSAVAVLLSGPLAGSVDRVLVQPDVWRGAASYFGYRYNTPIPAVLAIGATLRSGPGATVCASMANRKCLLVFAQEGGVWRLTDIDLIAALGAI